MAAGDSVHVELEPLALPDEKVSNPDPVTCPELETALADDPPLAQAWAALPATHRDEYGRWITVGPDPETRNARIERLRHRLTSSDQATT